jgi:hypothetical protein
MWQTRTKAEANGRILKLSLEDANGPLPFSEVLHLWQNDVNFRGYFNSQLAAAPFEAFRWETPALMLASLALPFECVLLNSPELTRMPDRAAFADYFQSPTENNIAVFPNLGKDALLVVPCPVGPLLAYGHLATFVRSAPEEQQQALWQEVGKAVADRLSPTPLWLNTAGAGVSWLHVRLDSRPKYYGYAAYKSPPVTDYPPPNR